MTKTKTLKTSGVVEQQGSIDSGANCIVPLCNERREAIHAPTDPSSLTLNKNLVEHLGKCNALTKATPPSEQISTIVARQSTIWALIP